MIVTDYFNPEAFKDSSKDEFIKFYNSHPGRTAFAGVGAEQAWEELQKHFPKNKVVYLPSLHANNNVDSITGKGEYALYNGNIEVPENAHAVAYLIENVFNKIFNRTARILTTQNLYF